MELPDLSRPPPNFIQNNFSLPPSQPDVSSDDLLPSLPYYELPAGLMVPLVKVCFNSYINNIFLQQRFFNLVYAKRFEGLREKNGNGGKNRI